MKTKLVSTRFVIEKEITIMQDFLDLPIDAVQYSESIGLYVAGVSSIVFNIGLNAFLIQILREQNINTVKELYEAFESKKLRNINTDDSINIWTLFAQAKECFQSS